MNKILDALFPEVHPSFLGTYNLIQRFSFPILGYPNKLHSLFCCSEKLNSNNNHIKLQFYKTLKLILQLLREQEPQSTEAMTKDLENFKIEMGH